MPKIHVHTAFNLLLTHSSGHQRFEPGVHDVSDEVADHWYTKDHADAVTGRARAAAAPQPEAAHVREAEPAATPPGDATEAQPDEFDAMDKAALRAFIKDRDGKNAPGFFDEDKLRHLARNVPAAQ